MRTAAPVVVGTSEADETLHECDCAPLWACMQKGADCSQLDLQLRACL
eukprot:SAG11_NODE_25328_length_360_cov_0.808429_1_plen_47_part_01